MNILEEYYPDDDHVFVYDNARTHSCRPPDAPSALKMPVKPKPLNQPDFAVIAKQRDGSDFRMMMRDGTLPDGSRQSFYFPPDHPTHPGRFKGMRIIIEERCERGVDIPDPKRLKTQCGGSFTQCPPDRIDCCCRRILYNQPDFVNPKSLLEEICEERGFRVVFLPKYHCELNPIEACWGYAKRTYRQYPSSTLDADLERNLLASLETVPLFLVRR